MPYTQGTYGQYIEKFVFYLTNNETLLRVHLDHDIPKELLGEVKNELKAINPFADVQAKTITMVFVDSPDDTKLPNKINSLKELFLPQNEASYDNTLDQSVEFYAKDLCNALSHSVKTFDTSNSTQVIEKFKDYTTALKLFTLSTSKDNNKKSLNPTPQTVLKTLTQYKQQLTKISTDYKNFSDRLQNCIDTF